MIFETKTGTQSVTKEQVWAAWKHIRAGGKGMGIDQVSVEAINANPRKYLYPLWNGLSSGSYFPPALKETAIQRYLGIPTVCDRGAQQVIRTELEAILEPKFNPNSFGSRPERSAHQSLSQCAQNSRGRWYVLSVDIKSFFDNLDHELLMNMLEKHMDKPHILLYCRRWLSTPVKRMDGSYQLNEEKTHNVYCYRTARFHKESSDVAVSFDYLGFTFKPRLCKRDDGQRFWGGTPGISTKSKIYESLRRTGVCGLVHLCLSEIAELLASPLRGWIRYYGHFRLSALGVVFDNLNYRLLKWVKKKFKYSGYRKAKVWLRHKMKCYPNTFVHWLYGFTGQSSVEESYEGRLSRTVL